MLPKIDTDLLNKSTTIEAEYNFKKAKLQQDSGMNNASFLTDIDASRMDPVSVEAWGPDLPKEAKLTDLEGINLDRERARHLNLRPFATKAEISKDTDDPLYYS